MRSTITARGQTVIPAEIRQRFHLSPSDRLEWIVDESGIRVVPVKSDPIEAFRGRGKGAAPLGFWLNAPLTGTKNETLSVGYVCIADAQGR